MMLLQLVPLLLAISTTAADDASALVQSAVRTASSFHRPRTVSYLTKQHMKRQKATDDATKTYVERVSRTIGSSMQIISPQLSDVPMPGGVYVKRTSEATGGNKVWLNVSQGCTVTDKFGQDNCSLSWGDSVTIVTHVELPEGIKKADTITLRLGLFLEAKNKENPFSQLIPSTPLHAEAGCTLCEGSCKGMISGGGVLLESITPSFFSSKALCGTTQGEKFMANLTNLTILSLQFQMPEGFDPSMEVVGFVNFTTELMRNGTVALSQNTNITVIPGAPNLPWAMSRGAKKQPRDPTTRLSPEPSSVISQFHYSSPGQGAASSHLAVIDKTLRQVVPAMLMTSRNATTMGKYAALVRVDRKQKKKKINGFFVKHRVSNVSKGSTYNLTAAARANECTTVSEEAVDCKFLFNSVANLTKLDYHMAYTADEGSYVDLTIKSKVGGLLGVMLSPLLKTIQQRVPVCGHNATQIIDGKESQIDAGACGFFSYRLVVPPFQAFVSDFGEMPTGMQGADLVPKKLADWPSTQITVDIHMKRADGTTIFREQTIEGFDHFE